MPKVDLHIHTNISDGLLSPEEVISLASKNGCHIIAITDHDIVTDFNAKSNNMTIIPGIEFNTAFRNLHLLGYGMKDIDLVNKEMLALRIKNEEVCYKVIELMYREGYDISADKVINYLKSIDLDYSILDKRKIVKYLMYKNYSKSIVDTYQRLLGVHGTFYVPNYKITPKEIIELVSAAGGITVLAHPITLKLSPRELYEIVKELKEYGLEGIEVDNRRMLSKDDAYTAIADSLGLLKTVGSDFHELPHDRIGINIKNDMYHAINKKLVKKK